MTLLGLDVDAVGERPAHRDAHHALAGALDAVGDRLAPVVVDADDRGAVALHARDQPLLDRRVVRKRAVAVEMVLGDVEQDADRGIERGREIDLDRTSTRSRARGRGAGGSSERIAVPILPPSCAS